MIMTRNLSGSDGKMIRDAYDRFVGPDKPECKESEEEKARFDD